MQAARPPQRLRSGRGSRRQSPVAAVPEAAAVDVLPPQCRICWLEADVEEGGALLAPCRCSGSSRCVHQRCLAAWMGAVAERKGVHAARHCDICRARYAGLPRELHLREPPVAYLRRKALAAMATPAGTAASYYAAAGMAFSTAWAVRGALLSGRWDAPLLSAARYLQGLGVHLAVGWAQAHAVGALPWPLEPAAAALCASARRLAMAIEYAHMGLLLLFGGLAKGFAQGALLTALAPIKLAAHAAGALRHGACAVAGLLPHVRRKWQRRQRKRWQAPAQQQRQPQQGPPTERGGPAALV
ncbi:hypothetical protein CHLNCDRAFT_144149 [Chlorella variabilis]|uniref:RING-CH-type domain-containing protein n=1 Tax=Chlorella variabilis TaxID=554065 RepID=E1ZC09_CHLVA|nr:hypothetical protein CHLNCDRAFT_144149 [Chlorella variabilis]EFN56526.1 hypothetical protein CHLNCDRAFT_144149 [Chlorella variabilis]|eukprot:XP_005848628.1 hypothetical protein CHLNCDRAFT_144149 [Chlorella variabilis]